MEEQIEHNLNCAPEVYSDRERAREQMREYFPTQMCISDSFLKERVHSL